ncbi:4059_t:CDS:2, partial [Ambispora gerdemannii]
DINLEACRLSEELRRAQENHRPNPLPPPRNRTAEQRLVRSEINLESPSEPSPFPAHLTRSDHSLPVSRLPKPLSPSVSPRKFSRSQSPQSPPQTPKSSSQRPNRPRRATDSVVPTSPTSATSEAVRQKKMQEFEALIADANKPKKKQTNIPVAKIALNNVNKTTIRAKAQRHSNSSISRTWEKCRSEYTQFMDSVAPSIAESVAESFTVHYRPEEHEELGKGTRGDDGVIRVTLTPAVCR